MFKGAPGGDDYHQLWIDPQNPQRRILGVDQGATVSQNGGETWSSWFNQPTGQFYKIAVDDAFPYRIYGGQQDSGTVRLASRSDYGQLTFRDWHPVGADEYSYVAADPLNPDIFYGGTVFFVLVFIGLVTDSARQIPKRSNQAALTPAASARSRTAASSSGHG